MVPPKSPSASEHAYIAIERLLVTGHIAPHSIINEMEICKSLGLGRTPVRMALQRLADHGLLEIIPRRGIFVTEVDFQGQMQILEARRELDRLLCETANALATESDRSALRAMAGEVEDAHVSRDFTALLETDLRFKLLLLSIARNRFLTKAVIPIHALSRRFYFMHAAETDQGVDTALVHLIRTVADGDSTAVGVASCKLTDELERFAKETIFAKLGIQAGLASGYS